MVGVSRGGRRTSSRPQEPGEDSHNSKNSQEHQQGSFQESSSSPSVEMAPQASSSSSSNNHRQDNNTATKTRGRWFSGLLLNHRHDGNGKNDRKTDKETSQGDDNDNSSRSNSRQDDGEEDASTRHSSAAQSASNSNVKVVETYPDSENEFHEVIRNQNWDLLEILLKEYDYKKYIKPKEPTKTPRKLRVAKYLPDVTSAWKKEVEVPPNPLYGLDALGRAPLHLCCGSPCPDRPLLRLLFCARDLASVPDATGSLPIHLAVTHEKGVEVVDKLIRGYYQGSMVIDATGSTPLMWATEIIRRQDDQPDRTNKAPSNNRSTYWTHPSTKEAVAWQVKQKGIWQLVHFMLENRIVRRQKLIPREYRQVVKAMSLAAPPPAVSLLLDLGQAAMKKDIIAGPSLSICITRQYPLDLLEKVIELSPMDFAKDHKDNTGRGVVAAHYRIGCIAYQDDSSDEQSKRQSFRMTMQSLANAAGNLQEKFTPSKEYLEWWGKMKYLINLWGTHTLEDDASHDDFDMDDLVLHNALSNPDVPPSLIRLLTSLRPHATDLEHPKSTALPIHLACRVWRFKHYPSRRGEKESHMDKVVLQLLEGDFTRTRKRYRDRLPIHHAVAAGKNWQFIKPLVVHDRKSLKVRDPTTKLYPFQLAAVTRIGGNMEELTRYKFTNTEWNKMKEREKAQQVSLVESYYDREQLSLIYQLLKQLPHAMSHESIVQEEAARSAKRPKRKIIMEGLHATEEVTLVAQMQMIRGMFGLGSVAGHFIAWGYENTRRGWKTHRSNFGVLKEAIMDGFIATSMDKWWRKLKFWIWQDCPWESPAIPRRDDFLLHGALCNPDVSPWIIDLILECFPRSASIPLPASDGCYPLHIACVTDRYVPLPFEFANKRTIIEMTAKAYPDAALLKWKTRLPLHLAIAHSKDWAEIQYLADEEPLALSVPDPKLGIFPFQLMAINRPYTTKERSRFEIIARKEVGKEEWKALSAHEKVTRMSEVLEQHEIGALGGVWELLKRNPVLVSVSIADNENSGSRSLSSSGEEFVMAKKGNMSSSGSDWMKTSTQSLSLASIDFLEDVFEKDNLKAIEKRNRENAKSSRSLLESSMSDPFLGSSFRLRPRPKDSSTASKPDQSFSDVSQEIRSAPSVSPQEEEGEYIEYIIEDEEDEYEYEEVISGPDDQALNTIKAIETSLPESAEKRKLLKLGPNDHDELCHPRRKDVIFIRKASAYVLWRSTTLEPGTLKGSSRRSYWAHVLQQMGDEIDLGDVHKLRHERDQSFVASAVVDGTTVFIDEDDTYVWLLCGEVACSAAENYDIDAAIIVTSSLLDQDTGVWLDAFRLARRRVNLSGKDGPHRILEWILGNIEKPAPGTVTEIKRFMITRKILRSAFSNGTMDHSGDSAEQIIEKSTRILWFDVAKLKMEVKIRKRIFIGVRFFILRRAGFERQRLKFYENQKSVKLFKSIKKKQRHAARRASTESESVKSVLEPPYTGTDGTVSKLKAMFERPPRSDKAVHKFKERCGRSKSSKVTLRTGHLDALHQPSQPHSDDDASIRTGDIFEPPKPPPPNKPLVAAALKAKVARDQSQFDASQNVSAILETMNQPKHTRGQPSETPLVAAALKAKSEAESRSGRHLVDLHQPASMHTDSASLGSHDLFDEPRGLPPEKPLVAAALKAKKLAEGRSGRHLVELHQPATIYDDSASLGSNDLFEEPRGPPPEKPLVAAALKAKKAAEGRSGRHLLQLHQPADTNDGTDDSLASDDLFDPPRGPPAQKPMLAAALKAKQKAEEKRLASSSKEPPKKEARTTITTRRRPVRRRHPAHHLKGIHQPKTIEDDDNASLAANGVFDPPRGPPPSRPLLAAALKAKEQQDNRQKSLYLSKSKNGGYGSVPSHLEKVHQPTSYEQADDDNMSLVMGAVFDPPRPPPPAKPLVAAALKAKEQRDNGIYKSPQTAKSILKASNFGQSPEQIKIPEGSMTMGDIYLSTPKGVPGSPRKEGASARRTPAPMTAKMIRMNSVEQFMLDDSIPQEIEAHKSPELAQKHSGLAAGGGDKKKTKQRGSSGASVPQRVGSSSSPKKRSMRRSAQHSKKEAKPEKRKSGVIMSLLGKGAGQSSS